MCVYVYMITICEGKYGGCNRFAEKVKGRSIQNTRRLARVSFGGQIQHIHLLSIVIVVQSIHNSLCSESVLKHAVQRKVVIVRFKLNLSIAWSVPMLRSFTVIISLLESERICLVSSTYLFCFCNLTPDTEEFC